MPSEFANGSQWITVTCSDTPVGNSVRIEKDSQALVFCGLRVWGYKWA